MPGILQIDFQVFFYMVIGIFGLAGFMRGWWKEAITTGLLVFLLILLAYPELAANIIDQINTLLGRVREVSFVSSGAVDAPSNVDPAESQFYIILMTVLVIISYFIGNAFGNFNTTTGGRIFGGILGLTNGFIILSLVKEYILRRYLPEGTFMSAAAAPEQITMTITDVPQASITDGFGLWVFIIGGALLLVFAVTSQISYTSGKIKRRPPLGYK